MNSLTKFKNSEKAATCVQQNLLEKRSFFFIWNNSPYRELNICFCLVLFGCEERLSPRFKYFIAERRIHAILTVGFRSFEFIYTLKMPNNLKYQQRF